MCVFSSATHTPVGKKFRQYSKKKCPSLASHPHQPRPLFDRGDPDGSLVFGACETSGFSCNRGGMCPTPVDLRVGVSRWSSRASRRTSEFSQLSTSSNGVSGGWRGRGGILNFSPKNLNLSRHQLNHVVDWTRGASPTLFSAAPRLQAGRRQLTQQNFVTLPPQFECGILN